MAVLVSMLLTLGALLAPRSVARADESAPTQSGAIFPSAAPSPWPPASEPKAEGHGYFPAEPGWLWRRSHGSLVLSLGAELAIASRTTVTRGHKVAGGVEGQLRRAAWLPLRSLPKASSSSWWPRCAT